MQATVREILTALAGRPSIGMRDVSLGVKIHQKREIETDSNQFLPQLEVVGMKAGSPGFG